MAERAILLVEDDRELCELMADYLSRYEFSLVSVQDGYAGLSRALEGNFDLVILDGMLPVLDGFEVLKQLRRRSAVPIIMRTARAEVHDRVAGLSAGADDYLTKPFAPDELLSRIRAVLESPRVTGRRNTQILKSTG